MLDKCESSVKCATCNLNHHTLLHPESESVSSTQISTSPKPQSLKVESLDSKDSTVSDAKCHLSSDENLCQSLVSNNYSKVVLLGTAVISIRSLSGAFVPVRALIDSGSQVSFITSSCAQRLGLTLNKCDVTVAGLAQRLVNETKGLTSCVIKPIGSVTPQFTTEAIVLREITSKMPSISLPVNFIDKFRSLNLADPKYDTPGPIDFLIAADIFPFIFDGQKISDEFGLTAMHSVFGWVISGKVNLSSNLQVSSFLAVSESTDDLLKRFWEVEEPPVPFVENPEESSCENIFKTFHSRNPEGRYVVPIPFRTEQRPIYNSHSLAIKRLVSLERRLNKSFDLKRQYQDFLDEYEKLGHMTKVPYQPSSNIYYIPHHAVINSKSPTTKLRVVFDGSARNNNEPSLNQLLHIGPKLQADIVAILIRFMLHEFVFVADICQMYRQILIRPEDRCYQHIIWRRSSDDPIEEFQLNTVTYGLTPSPYLALRTLRQLAQDEGEKFPQAVNILLNDIYIDDIISGGSTISDTRSCMIDLINLLRLGGFELRKWGSNCPELILDMPAHLRQTSLTFDSDGMEIIKILGVQWNAITDSFTYHSSQVERLCTKRIILSHIARIYDPIGWLSPVTFRLKCLIQHLWRLGLNWDDEVPSFISEEWITHCEHLHLLSQLSIPRFVLDSNLKETKLVGYCDASERGYCGVVYLCVVYPDYIKPHLLLAKSKVAPLKTLSIPRLELCGAVLLSKLLKYCFNLLISSLPTLEMYAFSDSTTVLSWLQTPTYQLKTYVAARVNQILDLISPSVWHHVVSESNPADCASRGLQPQQLIEHSLWWKGPPWLSQSFCDWPIHKSFSVDSNLPELKNSSTVNAFSVCTERQLRECWIPISKFSSLTKLIRVTTWCYRYFSNLRLPAHLRSYGPLTLKELEQSTWRIIHEVQWQSFPEDMKLLSNNKDCLPHLRRLCPFLDSRGCLRVGGRLCYSNLSDPSIHPFILPKKSHFTDLVIDYYHLKYLHAGPRILQSLICRTYWILSIRNAIRSRLAKCNTCFKCKPIPLAPKMADLPPSRVIPCRPFLNVGIDFGGPFSIKESRRRNAKISKCYLSLFVCMTTKAVHLEVVSDLSTSAFLAAFDRFISRRGLCTNVYTDCGTNFVGARRCLNELYQVLQSSDTYITDYLAQKSINWYLNIPTASHWGGLWEAGIRSTKYHLKRVLNDQILTFEELSTLFTKIEAVLNSRPLCSWSPDPGEINVLTPGHFLTGGPLVAVPEYDLRQENLNRLDRWQFLQHATQHFWDRWSREYLHTLQQRAKWFTSQEGLKEGDIVLIVTEKCPSTHWSLGRVEKLIPGKDGIVRAAAINTPEGKSLLRPLVKLCPIPSQ